MSGFIGRRLAAWLAVLSLLLVFPAGAAATVSGGCTAEGHATTSAGIDITTEPVWHLRSTDVVGGSGSAPVSMTAATISAYALGIAIPVANGSGNGDTTGSIDGVSLETYSKLGKVFVVAGHATGGGTCDGQILIIIDDVDAMFTVLGGGGLILFILGLAAMILTGRGGGCLNKIFGFVFGGIAATGLGLSLAQFEIISPTSPVGLVIVLIGAILGLVVALRIGPPGMPKPPAEPAVAGAVGTPPEDAMKAAVDAPADDGAPDLAPPPTVTGMIDTPGEDAAKAAMDAVDGPPDEPPPPDPNAPGVDVRDPGR